MLAALVSSEAFDLSVDIFSLCLHIIFPLCVCVWIYFSYKYISDIGLGPTLIISLYINYLCKGPISKYNHILR